MPSCRPPPVVLGSLLSQGFVSSLKETWTSNVVKEKRLFTAPRDHLLPCRLPPSVRCRGGLQKQFASCRKRAVLGEWAKHKARGLSADGAVLFG